jgi:CRP-like cAMP-binding protein
LRQDGLLKVSQGLTTLAQVLEKTVLPKESLPHYLLNTDEMIFENNDVIIKEGNNDTNFYKLIQGNLAVYKDQAQIAEISKANSYFGEMSALLGGLRTATIRSVGKSVVKVFPGDKLMEVIDGYPEIAKVMLTAMVDRLGASNAKLSETLRDKADLERTYLGHLSPSAPTPVAGAAPSAGARRSAALERLLAVSAAKKAAGGNGGAPPPSFDLPDAAPRPAPKNLAAAPPFDLNATAPGAPRARELRSAWPPA